jgi:hypothetical protein
MSAVSVPTVPAKTGTAIAAKMKTVIPKTSFLMDDIVESPVCR